MGFDKNQLIASLQNRLQNEVSALFCFLWSCFMVSWHSLAVQATVAYYLLLDNRLRTTSGYLGSEFQESMVSVVFLFSCISRCWLWAVQYLWCYKFLANFLSCFMWLWSLGLIFLSSNRWNTNFSNWTSAAWVYRISGVWLEAAFCSWKEMGPWSSGNFHVKCILILLCVSWIILIHISVIV